HDEVQEAGHAADGAVAVERFDVGRCIDFEAHAAAMAAAAMHHPLGGSVVHASTLAVALAVSVALAVAVTMAIAVVFALVVVVVAAMVVALVLALAVVRIHPLQLAIQH